MKDTYVIQISICAIKGGVFSEVPEAFRVGHEVTFNDSWNSNDHKMSMADIIKHPYTGLNNSSGTCTITYSVLNSSCFS